MSLYDDLELDRINSSLRIGYAIAKRLGEDGAHVVVSSRKQDHVDRTVRTLKDANLKVTGQVCHVGKREDRDRLVQSVSCIIRQISNISKLMLCSRPPPPHSSLKGAACILPFSWDMGYFS